MVDFPLFTWPYVWNKECVTMLLIQYPRQIALYRQQAGCLSIALLGTSIQPEPEDPSKGSKYCSEFEGVIGKLRIVQLNVFIPPDHNECKGKSILVKEGAKRNESVLYDVGAK